MSSGAIRQTLGSPRISKNITSPTLLQIWRIKSINSIIKKYNFNNAGVPVHIKCYLLKLQTNISAIEEIDALRKYCYE